VREFFNGCIPRLNFRGVIGHFQAFFDPFRATSDFVKSLFRGFNRVFREKCGTLMRNMSISLRLLPMVTRCKAQLSRFCPAYVPVRNRCRTADRGPCAARGWPRCGRFRRKDTIAAHSAMGKAIRVGGTIGSFSIAKCLLVIKRFLSCPHKLARGTQPLRVVPKQSLGGKHHSQVQLGNEGRKNGVPKYNLGTRGKRGVPMCNFGMRGIICIVQFD
jgi:hypothetical protein